MAVLTRKAHSAERMAGRVPRRERGGLAYHLVPPLVALVIAGVSPSFAVTGATLSVEECVKLCASCACRMSGRDWNCECITPRSQDGPGGVAAPRP